MSRKKNRNWKRTVKKQVEREQKGKPKNKIKLENR